MLSTIAFALLVAAGVASADSSTRRTHQELRKLFLPQPWAFANASDKIFFEEAIAGEWAPIAEAHMAAKAANVHGLTVTGLCRKTICRYELQLNGNTPSLEAVQNVFVDPLFKEAPAQYPMAAYNYATPEISVLYLFDLRDSAFYLPRLREQLAARR